MTALREAYELIRDPEHWTQNAYARTPSGETAMIMGIEQSYPKNTKWCAAGAVWEVSRKWDALTILDDVATELFPAYPDIIMVNDLLGHAAVMQVYEKAIIETEGGL